MVLERGSIYFLFRPAPGDDAPSPAAEAFYIVLRPDDRQTYRVISLEPKRMPELAGGRRRKHLGTIENVADRPNEELGKLVGKGLYALAWHGRHTHLAYALDEPDRVRNPQWLFGIERRAAYVMTVRRPDERRMLAMPEELRRLFDGHASINVDPAALLDREGIEILLVGTEEDVVEDLGLRLDGSRPLEAPFEEYTRGRGASRP
jgi:hypothetical protein